MDMLSPSHISETQAPWAVREGMLLVSRASLNAACRHTKRMRQELPDALSGLKLSDSGPRGRPPSQKDPTESRELGPSGRASRGSSPTPESSRQPPELGLPDEATMSYPPSILETSGRKGIHRPHHNRRQKWRPCIVLFVDKPEADRAITVPITSRGGHHLDDEQGGTSDENERRWCFPIPNTPPHSIISPIPGEGQIQQEFADIPNWASRTDNAGVVKTGPQYLILGLPMACQVSDLRQVPGYERFQPDQAMTKWCQQKSLGFMSDQEVEEYALARP